MLIISEKDRMRAEGLEKMSSAQFEAALDRIKNPEKMLCRGLALAERSKFYRNNSVSSCAQYNPFYLRAKRLRATDDMLDDFVTQMMVINKKGESRPTQPAPTAPVAKKPRVCIPPHMRTPANRSKPDHIVEIFEYVTHFSGAWYVPSQSVIKITGLISDFVKHFGVEAYDRRSLVAALNKKSKELNIRSEALRNQGYACPDELRYGNAEKTNAEITRTEERNHLTFEYYRKPKSPF